MTIEPDALGNTECTCPPHTMGLPIAKNWHYPGCPLSPMRMSPRESPEDLADADDMELPETDWSQAKIKEVIVEVDGGHFSIKIDEETAELRKLVVKLIAEADGDRQIKQKYKTRIGTLERAVQCMAKVLETITTSPCQAIGQAVDPGMSCVHQKWAEQLRDYWTAVLEDKISEH
jgi:hypothetical protein